MQHQAASANTARIQVCPSAPLPLSSCLLSSSALQRSHLPLDSPRDRREKSPCHRAPPPPPGHHPLRRDPRPVVSGPLPWSGVVEQSLGEDASLKARPPPERVCAPEIVLSMTFYTNTH